MTRPTTSIATTIGDVLTFRTMLSPFLLQLLFWAGIGGCLYGTYVLVTLEHWAWWMALLFGPILTRVIFERALLAFRSYERLSEIAELGRRRETTV